MVRVMMHGTAYTYHAEPHQEPKTEKQERTGSTHTCVNENTWNEKQSKHYHSLPPQCPVAGRRYIILLEEVINILFKRIVKAFSVLWCETHDIKFTHSCISLKMCANISL